MKLLPVDMKAARTSVPNIIRIGDGLSTERSRECSLLESSVWHEILEWLDFEMRESFTL